MRGRRAGRFLGLVMCLAPIALAAAAVPEVQVLDAAFADPPAESILGGSLDDHFETFDYRAARRRGSPFWLKLRFTERLEPGTALVIRKGRHLQTRLTAVRGAERVGLSSATGSPGFRGLLDEVYVLPLGVASGWSVYARVEPQGHGAEELSFSTTALTDALAHARAHERRIALAFGALMALAITAFVIWFVLPDRLFLLYGTLVSLQALYLVYLSGQGFGWPVLSAALPLTSHAWNVPAALSGAIACLFVRRIADLQRFSARAYTAFGWLAGAFVVLAAANLGALVGLARPIAVAGNILFLGAAAFTLTVAFLAWRRGNRAAGWFLIAWGQLEVFTIATAIRLILPDAEKAELLLYYGLPSSIVTAAILIALGVADRQRDQRRALSEAERRAQTDPLTGALNRRSLVEHLDAACQRAQARGRPIALLFIDLDHFKQINDSLGHLAGDACLAAIIGPIHAELRQSDVLGRYGGEEFVAILSDADAAAARATAERILERIGALRVAGFGAPIQLTCSIGVAASDTLGVWGEELLAQADSAVYAAKRMGRNCVNLALPRAA